MHCVLKTKIAGFPIELHDEARGENRTPRFTVQYGKQIERNLPYATAAAKLGEAILHALTCEGLMDGHNAGTLELDASERGKL